ncbi:hypothetical protein ACFZAR_36430 [Streptomyces sp. NPDC008222]|uniref:hypothetical protein n=1 Tax=Streptomyces sp. NPDC008222 TaxID=3364820 RepID=UPI0036E3EEF7
MTTEIPTTPAPADDAGFEVMRADAVLTGRAMSSGQFLAGLIARGELETVGTPSKLPQDLFPGVDPVVVQEVWDRALAVGVNAGRAYWAPRLHPEELESVRGVLADAGFHAMGGAVGRSQRVVERARVHPGDGEIAREHG